MDDMSQSSKQPHETFTQRAFINPLHHLHDEVDRLFHDYAPKVRVTAPWRGSATSKHPIPVDVLLTEKGAEVRADLPGMNADDLDITLSGQRLVIDGIRAETSHEAEADFLFRECDYGAFRREIDLTFQPDEGKITASLSQGVLEIHIPKSAASKPRRHKIELRQD